jgi:hypothetical protein
MNCSSERAKGRTLNEMKEYQPNNLVCPILFRNSTIIL